MSENLNWENGYDHVGLDGVSGDRGDLSDPRDVHRWLESFDCSNLFKDLDAFDLSDSDGDGEMASVGDEEAAGLARPFSEELALAALSSIPNAGTTQKRRKEDYLRNLTEEDFEEGVERLCYRIVKANVEALFDKRTKPDQLVKAAQWLFGRTLGEVNFERCCETLGTRKDVLRLRIHYEFWRRWLVLPVEFPFMIDPVPDAVEGEIYIVAGDEGYMLARAAWLQPGIRSAALLEEASGGENVDRYRRALQQMAERYLMSQQNDNWYLTGRNPTLRAIDLSATPYRPLANQISWSKLY
ncbi:hypothetical protein ACUXAV_006452 [Cupriavidus metallidurans]|jgi:hypothetical protein|uniref:Uncharacterized protein n=2 Tax=Cupriavidus TaxID=106589 RepID=A0A3G8GW02_9BURK|nr:MULTISPECIES: hypothetical protein [Cupriavidus]MCA3774667.1 hypothetical protein [Cutibacterium sp.]AZG12159.1 hypothetical protein EHF44_01445 [Cupriavidus pauculus]MCA3184955.1 hypothetical protein [Cupriavidus sp.]MCA3194191.1 hypothetical protein [Cupriavidus sp.]MDE4922533.1 hypothetical protein [Cupriavidus metallidurans]